MYRWPGQNNSPFGSSFSDLAFAAARYAWVALACLVLLDVGAQRVLAEPVAVPVLLTFNLDTDADASALAQLGILPVATYFVTGAFAERHPELVRRLADVGTVGSLSYSHPDLTKLDPEALHRELALGKLVLEHHLGRPVEWFRAPFLASSPAVVRELRRLGLRYDSSDLERWPRQLELFALPVSTADDDHTAVSDHELLEVAGLRPQAAIDWLAARYDERAGVGRPLVVLLHPPLLVRQRELLDGFVALVVDRGGTFLSAQAYADQAARIRPQRWGVWVDLSQGPLDVESLVHDVQAAQITDVFLQAKDPDGQRYYPDPADGGPVPREDFARAVAALRGSGVRVHAWIAVLRDPHLAHRHPEWTMFDRDGRGSPDWLSPTHPAVREAVIATVEELLARYPLDGIHLDYLRYPSLEYDFAAAAVDHFRREQGIAESPLSVMFDTHYNAWTDWRSRQVRDVAQQVARSVHAHADAPVVSAALYADAATSYRVRETMAQDYSALAAQLDFVVPMTYVQEQLRTPDWIARVAFAARFRSGTRPIFAGLEAYQRPPQITATRAQFRASLDAAAQGYAGVVFYAYGNLFGRSGSERDLGSGFVEDLGEFRRALAATPLSAGADSAPANAALPSLLHEPHGLPWGLYAVAAAIFLGAAIAAARGRTRRLAQRNATPPPGPRGFGRLSLDPQWATWAATENTALAPTNEPLAGLLIGLAPDVIERFRLAALVESLGADGLRPAELESACADLALPRAELLACLARAGEIGGVDLRHGVLRSTPRGTADLQVAVAGGYERRVWVFIERLLATQWVVACPLCATPNLLRIGDDEPACLRCAAALAPRAQVGIVP